MRRTVPLHLYRLALVALGPFARFHLQARLRKGKEVADRLDERYGIAGLPRPAGPLVWIHGASIGETVAALALVEALVGRGLAVLVTSGTRTSADVLAKRLPAGAFHQFLPIDTPKAVRRFFAAWRPHLGVMVESELWPNLLAGAAAAHVPLVLANARMSDRSFRGWQRFRRTAGALLSAFEIVLARTAEDGRRFVALGHKQVVVTGDLKLDAAEPAFDRLASASLKESLGGRPVFVAASAHPGEAPLLAKALRAVRGTYPDLAIVLVPRHPDKSDIFEEAFLLEAFAVSRRSRSQAVSTADVYIADSVGELSLFLSVASVAFVGGSLIPHGGQNPVEAIAMDVPLLHGPHVANFVELYADLAQSGGTLPVEDAKTLASAITKLLSSPDRASLMTATAKSVIEARVGALSRTLAAISAYLPENNR